MKALYLGIIEAQFFQCYLSKILILQNGGVVFVKCHSYPHFQNNTGVELSTDFSGKRQLDLI